ncbi:urease accessory protein D isoform X3 [Juglans microcarpa x Juglans regia]|uniref:urease accessory protein D isoform X3 n=1 Tax=Juglans microcarpa x Juglans regia TaxID=2249226 RepID=UPI001B7F5E90|nr:urease accessory protein D isoform X3 [Juglans microcarpa x Juglans regia]
MKNDGKVVVEKVGGRSTVTRCFSKYPLKFIIPNKVGPSKTDAVWIYSLTYGGGIVSGDSISCELTIGDGCTTVLTTQASTKARIGSDAILAIVPDPVTCFSTARYSQKQVFRVVSDSNLVIVDWITSGRHESGERWDFDLYKSTNRILLEGDLPLFLDTVLLERGSIASIAERMQDYQVIAMVVLFGPKMKHIQNQVQEDVKKIMSEQLIIPSTSLGHQIMNKSKHYLMKPSFVASASVFGPKGIGVVVRIAAMTTESVYRFLQQQLASMEPLLGVSPYR